MAWHEVAASQQDRTTARLLVAGQLALLVAVAVQRRGTSWPVPHMLRGLSWCGQIAGVALSVTAAVRLGPGLTASPLPNAQSELHTDGLYEYVRHPVYAGVMLAAGSRTLATGNRAALLPLGLLGVLLHVKSGFEERRLAQRFPGYAGYAARTPRLVPTPFRAHSEAAVPDPTP
jgi:protein-S-isoprenylcysteine O-methyltransferase Ste14